MGQDDSCAPRGWMSTSDYNHWKNDTRSPPDAPPTAKKIKKQEFPAEKKVMQPQVECTKMITTSTGLEVLAFDNGFCPFANHHRTPFTINGETYLSVYQYVETKKAEYFGDFECSDAVMKCKSAKKIRELTYGIKNFDAEIWR